MIVQYPLFIPTYLSIELSVGQVDDLKFSLICFRILINPYYTFQVQRGKSNVRLCCKIFYNFQSYTNSVSTAVIEKCCARER